MSMVNVSILTRVLKHPISTFVKVEGKKVNVDLVAKKTTFLGWKKPSPYATLLFVSEDKSLAGKIFVDTRPHRYFTEEESEELDYVGMTISLSTMSLFDASRLLDFPEYAETLNPW